MTSKPKPASPESFGWLRRPELDTASAKVWERPDGQLQAFPRHATRLTLVVFPTRSDQSHA